MIIGIIGKMQSGKDTVGKIIQMLTDNLLEGIPNDAVEDCVLNTPILNPSFKIVKYADKLKDCVCLILGCTREQLEDDTFKDTPLGEEWWYYKDKETGIMYPYIGFSDSYLNMFSLIKLTPRTLLQLLGTQCGRQIIHPNIWINATMADYKSKFREEDGFIHTEVEGIKLLWKDHPIWEPTHFPNWIITDVRFPNEIQAIKDRGGLIIKVIRDVKGRFPNLYEEWENSKYTDFYHFVGEVHPEFYKKIMHESEVALDSFVDSDNTVINDFSISDTVAQLKYILKSRKLWQKENQLISN